MIPIVLTATITPIVEAYSNHRDPQIRKREYIEAISFYRSFSEVHFLENSGYPIQEDKDFPLEGKDLHYHRFEQPNDTKQNKGAQEFEMLDRFIKDTLQTDAFIKITGRYLYSNFGAVLRFIEQASHQRELLLDTYRYKSSAFSSLFYVSRRVYMEAFYGAWNEMSNEKGSWAEHVLYQRLQKVNDYAFLRPLPLLKMISGADGVSVDYARTPGRNLIKNVQRGVLAMTGFRQLLF